MADDHAADDRSDDLAECRDGGECAEPADARDRTVRLGHDALPADRCRRVCPMPSAVVATAMAQICSAATRAKAAAAPTARPKANRIAGWCRSVHRPKPTASTIGGTAKHAAVTPTVAASAPRARSRYVDTGRAKSDRDLKQEDAYDGADEPQRRKRAAPAGQNFQPRSGVATSTSTPSGSRNLKNRGGSAASAPYTSIPRSFSARHHGAGVLDRHADVVGPHRAVRPVGPFDLRVGLQQRVVHLAIAEIERLAGVVTGGSGVSQTLEAQDVLVELGGPLEVLDNDSKVSDAHCYLPVLLVSDHLPY